MKKILFHVGPPKSGTTSFQYDLWHTANSGALNAYYPIDVDLNAVAKMLLDRDFNFFNIFEKLILEFESSNHDVFIFSCELLSDLGYIDYTLLHQSVDFFIKFSEILSGYEVRLIYAINRDTRKRLYSTVAELIKHGFYFKDISIYSKISSLPYFNVDKLFLNIYAIFPTAKVDVIRFIDYQHIYRYFSEHHGIEVKVFRNAPLNVSPNLLALYIMHSLNLLGPGLIDESPREWNINNIDGLKNLSSEILGNSCLPIFFDLEKLFSFIDVKFNDEHILILKLIEKFNLELDFYCAFVGKNNLGLIFE